MYKKIERLCKAKGISMFRLAKDAGIAQSTLSQLKSRGGNLSLKNAIKVANYFGVELTELAGK